MKVIDTTIHVEPPATPRPQPPPPPGRQLHRHEYKKLGRVTTTDVGVKGTWAVFCRYCLSTKVIKATGADE